jgi:Ca2+-binding RTX toxin-like protein
MAVRIGTNLNDTITGTGSADTLVGLGGDDTLIGLGGNDTLVGGADNDWLDGGNGSDIYLVGLGDGFDTYHDTGTSGTDQIQASANSVAIGLAGGFGPTSGIEIITANGHSNVTILGADGGVTLDFSKTTLSGIKQITGGSGDDTITGSSGADVLDGGEGSDTYLVGASGGFDTYHDTGISGTDQIMAGANNVAVGLASGFGPSSGIEIITAGGHSGVTITGGGGADTFDFSATTLIGITRINGSGGADTITGSAGDDTIAGGAGNDTLNGGDGSDTYLVGSGDGTDTYHDTGASGTDRIVATANSFTINLASGFGPASGIEVITGIDSTGALPVTHTGVTIQGSAGADVLDFSATTLVDIAQINGSGGADTITGSAGNDTIVGGAGNDSLNGGDGSDTYLFGFTQNDGFDTYHDTGTSGIDRILANADHLAITLASGFGPASGIEQIDAGGHHAVSIQGSSGADVLDFSATTLIGIDQINGAGGADTITGSAGDDTIAGAGGNDTLDGGGGSDTYLVGVTANDGFDTYHDSGSTGTDQIVATVDHWAIELASGFGPASGIEIITAGANTDVWIQAAGGGATLDFSATTLIGITQIVGGGGADTITGSAGSDTILGGGGADTLAGGGGNDWLDGGNGNDTYLVGPGDGFDTYHDSGAGGTDQILATADNTVIGVASGFGPGSGIEVISAAGHAGVTIGGDVTDDVIDLTSVTLKNIVSIDGGNGNDTITGSGGNDVITGGAGNDTLRGGGGADTLVGGAGNDSLDGGAAADTYLVGANDGFDTFADSGAAGPGQVDQILATADNTAIGIASGFGPSSGIEVISANGHSGVSIQGDVTDDMLDFSATTLVGITRIDGGAGNDTITGSAGDDVIVGGTGNDFLYGGNGSDTYLVGPGDGFDSYADNSVSGTNRILATNDNVAIGLMSGFGGPGFGSGIQEISADGHAGVSIQGDATDDIFSFVGITLTGITKIDGGAGNDRITGTLFADVILGGDGDDQLTGLDGNDTLIGGLGDDTLLGGAGDDTLVGGPGTNTMDGGAGSDTYLVGPGDGINSIQDSGTDPSDVDRILATADNTAILLPDFAPFGSNTAGGIEQISADGHAGVTIEGGAFRDIYDFTATTLTGIAAIKGNDGDDQIFGSAGDDVIEGGAGNDTLFGGAGNDTLDGGADNDTLSGGVGNDTLIGGPGNNTLDGGEGSDTYLARPGDGANVYTDSGTGAADVDRVLATADNTVINIRAFSPFSGIEEISADGHAGVTISGGDAGAFLNFLTTKLTGITEIDGGADFDTITGSVDDDVINGGGRADFLAGGPGNDTLIGGTGNDSLSGGSGFDTAVFAGDVRDYAITVTNAPSGQATVADLAPAVDGDDGTDTLDGIEAIQFKNYTVYLDGRDNAVLAADDVATAFTGTPQVIASSALVSNDYDFDKDALSVTAVGDAVNGTVALNAAGDVVFTADSQGTASFAYTVSDGHGSISTASVTLTVLDGGDNTASAPSLTVSPAVGNEDTAIALVIDAALTDSDGSETLTIEIDGVPAGATLSAGSNLGNGAWLLAPTDLANLTVTPPPNSDADFTLQVRAVSTESNGGDTAETDAPLAVTVNAVADTPTLSVLGQPADGFFHVASGNENIPTAIPIQAALTDTDGSETLAVTITEFSGDSQIQLTDGQHSSALSPGQTIDVTNWNLGQISLVGVTNSDADAFLDIRATATEASGGATASSEIALYVQVQSEGAGVEDHRALDFPFPDEGGVRFDGPVADLDTNGFADQTGFGRSVSGIGDINGDGYADLLIGASQISPGGTSDAGGGYVVFGAASGLGPVLSVDQLDGSDGFALTNAVPEDFSGLSVGGGGDFNGDGFADYIIARNSGADVLFGHPGPFAASLDLSDAAGQPQGSPELRIDSSSFTTISSVANAGDVNGDGYDDFVLAGGVGFVIYGHGGTGSGSLSLTPDNSTLDGTNGTLFTGNGNLGLLITSANAAGDVNGDGYADMVFGAAAAGGAQAAFVVFGTPQGFGPEFDFATFDGAQNRWVPTLDGTNGFMIVSSDPSIDLGQGMSVSSAGDINGDGIDDLIIGGPDTTTNDDVGAGAAYVVFGQANGFPATIDLATLDGTHGFKIEGEHTNDRAGLAVSRAGDFNGDGYDDLLVTSQHGAFVPYQVGGGTYVIFGSPSGFGPAIDLASLPASEGLRLDGGRTVASASAAGDVNGDGFDDILLGAPDIGFNANGVTGASYLVFGYTAAPGGTMFGQDNADDAFSTAADDVAMLGLGGNDTLTAGGQRDLLYGGSGDDTLWGSGGSNVLKGGIGNDTLIFQEGTSETNVFSGGPGFDTLQVHGNLDLATLNAQSHYRQFTGIEQIDLTDGTANTLTLGNLDPVHLPDQAQATPLRIVGEAGDVVRVDPLTWTATGQSTMAAGHDFDIYSNGKAQLYIDKTLTVNP